MAGIIQTEAERLIEEMTLAEQTALVILRYIEIKGAEEVTEMKRIKDPAVSVVLDQMRIDGLLISTVGRDGMVYRLTKAGQSKLDQYRPVAEALTRKWGTKQKMEDAGK